LVFAKGEFGCKEEEEEIIMSEECNDSYSTLNILPIFSYVLPRI
jgi:hypothetical protein